MVCFIISAMASQPEHPAPSRNIILTGFMGAGKTAAGKQLAKLMNREFVDMDTEIVRRHGISIATIFSQHGEERFREWEGALALELAMRQNVVVAAGGGSLVDDKVFHELCVFGFLAYLEWPYEVLWERIEQTGRYRPLAARGRDGLRRLFREREPRYRQSHLTVRCAELPANFIAKVVRHAFTI